MSEIYYYPSSTGTVCCINHTDPCRADCPVMKEVRNREFDTEIAIKVMGQPMPPPPGYCTGIPTSAWNMISYPDKGTREWVPLPFSTSIAAAMDVVEVLRKQYLLVCIDRCQNGKWRVFFGSKRAIRQDDVVHDKSLPRAICLAALKILE